MARLYAFLVRRTFLSVRPISDIEDFVSPTYLAECFTYDPETGALTWKARPEHHFQMEIECTRHRARCAGKPAGGCNKGYRYVRLCGVPVAAHYIAWAIHYGEEAPGRVFHINGRRHDNRIANLCIGRAEAERRVAPSGFVPEPPRREKVAGRRMKRRPGAPRT